MVVPEVLEGVLLEFCEVGCASVFVFSDLALEFSEEELDVALGEGVGAWWLVVTWAPECWSVLVEWW